MSLALLVIVGLALLYWGVGGTAGASILAIAALVGIAVGIAVGALGPVLGREDSGEEHVVLHVDMAVRVGLELGEAGVERPIAAAPVVGHAIAIGVVA